jgi:hypothetical protein
MGIETALPIVGSLIGGASSRQAASMQADAAQRAQEQQAAQYAQTRADLQPWVQTGGQANNKLASLMGLDGSDPTAQLQSSPGYQFRYNEGMRGVENGAAARGGLLSGGTLKAIQKYGQDFASNEYQNQWNRLNSMSNTGQNSAAGQAAQSQAFGNASAANSQAQGNALASGAMGTGNAWANGISGAINGYQNNQMMNLLSGRNNGSAWSGGLYGGGNTSAFNGGNKE